MKTTVNIMGKEIELDETFISFVKYKSETKEIPFEECLNQTLLEALTLLKEKQETYREDSFWRDYQNFLESSKTIHHNVASHLIDVTSHIYGSLDVKSVADLGCGKTMSAKEILSASSFNCYFYYPVDKISHTNDVIVLDYVSQKDALFKHLNLFEITFFTSLFSSEIMMPQEEAKRFYEELFNEVPSLTGGLVSGFYYSSRISDVVVEETGGLMSYQSTSDLSETYYEMQMRVRNPSEMFGSDVVEVWKCFRRSCHV